MAHAIFEDDTGAKHSLDGSSAFEFISIELSAANAYMYRKMRKDSVALINISVWLLQATNDYFRLLTIYVLEDPFLRLWKYVKGEATVEIVSRLTEISVFVRLHRFCYQMISSLTKIKVDSWDESESCWALINEVAWVLFGTPAFLARKRDSLVYFANIPLGYWVSTGVQPRDIERTSIRECMVSLTMPLKLLAYPHFLLSLTLSWDKNA